jgi:hypothetical protein
MFQMAQAETKSFIYNNWIVIIEYIPKKSILYSLFFLKKRLIFFGK